MSSVLKKKKITEVNTYQDRVFPRVNTLLDNQIFLVMSCLKTHYHCYSVSLKPSGLKQQSKNKPPCSRGKQSIKTKKVSGPG